MARARWRRAAAACARMLLPGGRRASRRRARGAAFGAPWARAVRDIGMRMADLDRAASRRESVSESASGRARRVARAAAGCLRRGAAAANTNDPARMADNNTDNQGDGNDVRTTGAWRGRAARYDVAVVGYGPTGLVAASMLGRAGYRVMVIERWPTPYGLPRLTHIDGETARIVQASGEIQRRCAAPRRSTPITIATRPAICCWN